MMFVVYDPTTGKTKWTSNTDPGIEALGLPWSVITVSDDALGGMPISTFSVSNGALVPYAPTLTDAKAMAAGAAMLHTGNLMDAGFTYGGVLYQIDAESQSQLAAMGALAVGSMFNPADSPWPTGFYWIAADNSHVPMDAATTYSFARSVALYVSACILQCRAIKDAIAGAVDEAALDVIDVTAGYPTAAA